jgi:hypothetical protein
MDEFALLLAGPDDHVVLKEPPDPGYLSYLRELGLALPTVHAVTAQDPARCVTEDALADSDLIGVLGRLAGAFLWPHGVSSIEEDLARRCGVPLAAPSATVCKAVNSKIYSRLVAHRAGVPQPEGMVCRDLDELAVARDKAASWLAAGRQVVVKDAFGVSGKGILVVTRLAQLDAVQRMVERRARRAGVSRVGLVIEEWLPKSMDLNYQLTVDRAGNVRLDFVREALAENGVHKGHRMPADLSDRHLGQIDAAARALGGQLAADGYFGVAGVDGLVCTDGRLMPMIEINARNNMSTYQERLRERFVPEGTAALATRHPMRLTRPMTFDDLRDRLDGMLLGAGDDTGVLVNNFATVNAAASTGAANTSFDGRLYTMVVAPTAERAAVLDRKLAERLREDGQGR